MFATKSISRTLSCFLVLIFLSMGAIPAQAESLASPLYASAGTLDATFGTGGKVTTSVGIYTDEARAVAIQLDGKIVVAGHSAYDFAIVRYNSDGSLDTSFGTNGKVFTSFLNQEVARAIAIQDDGKIIAAGYTGASSGGDWEFALARYNSDGSLDTSFDSDGKVRTNLGSNVDYITALAIQADGKIVAVGSKNIGINNDDIALVRYNADGSLDTSFDTDGIVTTAIGSGSEFGASIAIQPDGKIIVGGTTFNQSTHMDFALLRYNSDGSLDTSLDTDGIVTTDFNNNIDRGGYVAIQPDDRIVIAGSNDNDDGFVLARYNSNGSLDTNFGMDGFATTPYTGIVCQGIALQANGKIVAVGYGYYDFALTRFYIDGSLDTSFGANGLTVTDIGGNLNDDDMANAIAIQPDGKIIAAGYTYNEVSNYDFALARYNGDDVTPAPEMKVKANNTTITDGDTTPSTADYTDFGSALIEGGTVDRIFTILNIGTADLTLGGTPKVAISGTNAADFSVTVAPTSPVTAGGSTTLTVRFDPSAVGIRSATISIDNNDSDENPYNFSIQGTGTGTVPEMNVKGNSITIVDGDIIPSITDHTDFGNALIEGGTVDRIFTIENPGTANLTLSGTPKVVISGTNAADFSVTVDPASPITASSTTTFTVHFDPSAAGIRTAAISIDNNDSDENPYDFSIQGTGIVPIAPEMNVKGNNASIADDDTTPSTTDYTDFGDTNISSGTVDRTFTIENAGNSNLILSGTPKVVIGGTNAADFSVTALPTSPVTTGGSTTFTVHFDPSAKGIRSATISIDNNDSDENPYNFSIQGTGTIPELTVTKTADTNDGICDSDCSLREAINAANILNGSNTIIFDDTLGTVSIALTSSLPSITDTSGLTIDGGADVTVDGNNLYRVFYVNSNVSLTLNNITIARGYISGDRGGGVYNNDGNLTIINSTFSGNKSSLGGGGIYNTSNGSLTVIRSTFSSNETAGGGGGIQNLGVMTVKNSTFYGNHASSGGGGIFNYYSGKIYNSTFSDNTDPNGGGVWNSGDLWLYNTIIANSGLGKDCYLYNLNSRIFGNNNLIEASGSNACSLVNGVNGNIIGVDPNLEPFTGSPAYFTIDASSPAFNAGDNNTCESTDQRGSARPQGARCDIGAFEFGAPTAVTLIAPIGNIEKDYNPNYAWNNVASATRYRLYVSGPKGLVLDQWFEAAKVCDETTCFVTPGPSATLGGGSYSWYVQTYNAVGYGPWSNTDANGVAQPTVFNTTVPAAPAAAILSAPKGDIGTDYTPAFTWGAVDTATYYRLYVSGPGGVALDQWYKSADICDATTCSTPSPALTGGAYVWYVQTYNSAGYGPWSNTDANGVVQPTHFNTAATLPSAAVLTEPIGNIGTNFYPAFKWDEVDTATDYRLYVSGPGGVVLDQWYKASDICPDSTCSVPSPRLGVGAHVWYVQTHSPAGYGPWSNTDANGVVQPTHFNTTAPALPVAAVLTEPKNDIGADYNPDFIWNKVDDALYYRLYVSGPAGLVLDKWYEALGICDATTCTVPGPQLTGGAHVWYVQTWNPAGYGPWSNTDANGVVQPTHFNTAATLPVAAVLTAPKGDLGTDYTPAYTWDKVTGAASYRLYVSGPGGVIVDQWYKAADICPTSACSVASPTLAGGAYVWYVQTYNPAGYGPWSNTDANGVVQPTHFNTTIPAVPVAAVLTEPIGSIGTDYNPSYKWGRVATATYYRLYVSGPTGVLLDKWYQATNICDATTCSVLSPTLAGGAHVWYVQTYNQSGYGPWSNTDANGVVQPTNFSTTLPALPAAAVLTAPSGTIASTSTTYTWNRVDMAIWYRLYVKGPYGLVLDQWYQAVDICNPTTCAVPGSSLARGDHTWWVQTYSSAGYGPWRNASFKVSP